MTRGIWADKADFVTEPAMAAAVLRGLDLPRIDSYLDEVARRGDIDLDALRRLSANTLVSMSGADHLRTRKVIAPFFSRSGLRPWLDGISQSCQTACDGLANASDPDLVRDFTLPLFLTVMPEILGLHLPPTREAFEAVETAQRLTEPYLSVTTLKALNAAAASLVATCAAECDARKAAGAPTLLEFMRARRDELPADLDPEYFVVGLLVGSNSATQSLAFALHGLLSGPVSRWHEAAESGWALENSGELLGHYQSTRTLVRVAGQNTEIEGCPFREAQHTIIDIVAVNSKLRQKHNQRDAHMSFGSGPHKCPGLFLSELLFESAVPVLARRFPNLTLKPDECRFVVTPMMQAPTALPCDLDEISRRISQRLCDIRDMDTARGILCAQDAFRTPPMESHLRALAQASDRDLGPAIHIARNAMFFMEGDRHVALRDALQGLLGASSISKWTPVIDRLVTGLLDSLANRRRVDLVRDFSDPLREKAMMRILGISCGDMDRFTVIAPRFQEVLEPWLSFRDLQNVQSVFAEALSFMTVPDNGQDMPSVLESLLADPPEGFDENDLKAVVLVLYGASFNLSHTLSNALKWVLNCPPEVRAMAADLDWLGANLEDLIARCSAPKFIYRVAGEATQAGPLKLNRGDTARLNLRVLNRQTKDGRGHVSFGQGLHRCMGAAVSRHVIKHAIPALFQRFPDLEPVAQMHLYHPMSQTVALATLPCDTFKEKAQHV